MGRPTSGPALTLEAIKPSGTFVRPHERSELIRLETCDSVAFIAPNFGANCVSSRVGPRDLIQGPENLEELLARPAPSGCPVLFPFPGKIPGRTFAFQGVTYELPRNAPDGTDAHVHGFVSHHAWRVVARSPAACVCELDERDLGQQERRAYPWQFRLSLRWSLRPGVLRADVRVSNRSDADMPFGFGLHPYLRVPENAAIHLPATLRWPSLAGIPIGSPVRAAGPWVAAQLGQNGATLLTGLPPGTVVAAVGDIAVRFSSEQFSEVVLYRPTDPGAVCIEPWSSVSSAARTLEAGQPHALVCLNPGQTWEGWIEIGAVSPPAR